MAKFKSHKPTCTMDIALRTGSTSIAIGIPQQMSSSLTPGSCTHPERAYRAPEQPFRGPIDSIRPRCRLPAPSPAVAHQTERMAPRLSPVWLCCYLGDVL